MLGCQDVLAATQMAFGHLLVCQHADSLKRIERAGWKLRLMFDLQSCNDMGSKLLNWIANIRP